MMGCIHMRCLQITVGDDERKSVPNSFAPSTPRKPKARKDSPLLTIRSDLTKVREALLKKGNGREALGLVDYTLDSIDEYIAEGGHI